MTIDRGVRLTLDSQPTIEGAGVHLKRAFGFGQVPRFDPFLMLDDFRATDPHQYIQGFPWHPHRGIETITYMLDGTVAHGDSLGNRGVIAAGDVQWMTAGSGIVHQEMPQGDADGRMGGFQLWANLPAASKMMPPRYRDVTRDQIPETVVADGTTIRVICGRVGDAVGPVQDIVIDPQLLDVTIPPGARFTHPTPGGHTVFAYLFEGDGRLASTGADSGQKMTAGQVVLFDAGERLTVATGERRLRMLLVSGKPIGEPVAWRGPIVMNTEAELETAFREYREGTFIKGG
jgi:redox-sensitive bicupin YhaK (pirin superfamily)